MNQTISKITHQPVVCAITAMPAETRALLDTYKMAQCATRHLRAWQAKTCDLMLIETGMGKLNAAAHTAAALQAYPNIVAILNIGIAGGPYPYGQSLLAQRVTDRATGAQWYPHLPNAQSFTTLPSTVVESLDKPDVHYKKGVVFDMEAAGVFSAASHYLSTSQVHCVKVVSDNADHPIDTINKATVSQLMLSAMPSISLLIETLQNTQFTPPNNQHETISSLLDAANTLAHHTVNDTHLLRELINRYINIANTAPTWPEQIANASQLRKHMQQQLDELPFVYRAS